MTVFLLILVIISYTFLAVMYWDMRRMEEDIDVIYSFIEDLYKKKWNRAKREFEENYAGDSEDDKC